MNQQLSQAIKHWNYVAPIMQYPQSKKSFNQLIEQLDELLMMVGEDETHPLMGLVDVISHIIAEYEEVHFPITAKKGVDALKYLMDSHQLKQSNLSEVGSQGVISEIINGKRQLNLRQIKLLAKKFHVDPSTFIDH